MNDDGRRGDASRVIARNAVRAHVADVGIDLFTEHGFENVTIDQIAAAAGISVRSFHRYFAAKEDVVTGDPGALGSLVRDAFAARPREEPVWTSLCVAYEAMLNAAPRNETRSRRTVRIMAGVPSLRARNLEKHLLWATMLTPLVAARTTGSDPDLAAEVMVHASLACLDIALLRWAASDETIDAVMTRCFRVFRPAGI